MSRLRPVRPMVYEPSQLVAVRDMNLKLFPRKLTNQALAVAESGRYLPACRFKLYSSNKLVLPPEIILYEVPGGHPLVMYITHWLDIFEHTLPKRDYPGIPKYIDTFFPAKYSRDDLERFYVVGLSTDYCRQYADTPGKVCMLLRNLFNSEVEFQDGC